MDKFNRQKELFAKKEHRTEIGEALCRGSLGTATELRTPPPQNSLSFVDKNTGEVVSLELTEPQKILAARRARFELQEFSSSILYRDDAPLNNKGFRVQHRTCSCTRLSLSNGADVYKSREFGKAHFSGLMKCANSRTCPVCSATISERKSNEMRLAANQCDSLGLHMSLLTFTAPHTASDSLLELVPKLSSSLQSFWRGAPAKKFKSKFGIVGHIRSFEIRYGVNGWHPHFHIIVFSKIALPTTNVSFTKSGKRVVEPLSSQHPTWSWIYDRWQNCCLSSGLDLPNLYGMDLQNGHNAGEYITKFGSNNEVLETQTGKKITWDMCDEVTKGATKISKKSKSLSPFDLLSNWGSLSYENLDHYPQKVKFWSLFNEYALATKGLSLIKWSRGLRSLFVGLNETELSDAEILNQLDDSADFLCHIDRKAWCFIVKSRLRSLVLELAENGGIFAINEFLASHNLNVIVGDTVSVSTGDFTPVDFGVSVPSELDSFRSESLKFEKLSHLRLGKKLAEKRKQQEKLLPFKEDNVIDTGIEIDESLYYENWLKIHSDFSPCGEPSEHFSNSKLAPQG